MNNSNDSANFWWWVCTCITFVGSLFLANSHLGRGKVIAELEKIIARQDKIINEQNETLKKLLKNDNSSIQPRIMD